MDKRDFFENILGKVAEMTEISLEKDGEYHLGNGDVLEVSLIDRSRFQGIEEDEARS
jgi:hypothetical protein